MSDNVSTIALQVDTTGVTSAKSALDGLVAQTSAAAASTDNLTAAFVAQGAAVQATGSGFGKYAQSNNDYIAGLQREVDVFGKSRAEIAARDAAVANMSQQEQKIAAVLGGTIDKLQIEEAASKELAKAQDAAAASVANLISKLELQASTLGKTAAQKQVDLLASKGASDAQIAQAAALAATIDGYAKTGGAAHGAASAIDGFSLANARAKQELVTMARELERGNYSKLAGSFSIFANSSGLLASVLTPVGVAIAVVATAMASLAIETAVGQAEQKKLQNALLLTNSAAGLTESGVHSLAKSISDGLAGATIRGAQQTLEGLVASGKLSGAALKSAALASSTFQAATGESADKANAFFLKATDGVAKFAAETNKQYNYISAAQYAYIKNLEQTGDAQKALQVTFDAFTARLKPAADNIGYIERAWDAAKKALSGYLDAALSIGKTDTIGAAIDREQKKLDELKANQAKPLGRYGHAFTQGASPEDIANQQALVDKLKATAASQAYIANLKAQDDARAKSGIALDELHDQYLTRAAQKEKEITAAKSLAAKADPGAANPAESARVQLQLQQTLAGINEKYKTRGAITDKDLVNIDIAKVKQDFKVIEDGLSDVQKIGAALYGAGLVDAKDYYAQQRALATATANTQIEELQRENSIYNAAIASRKGTQKDDAEHAKDVVVNEQKIQDIRAKTNTQLVLLDIQTKAYFDGLAANYERARQSEEAYLKQLQLTQSRSAASVGQSTQEQAFTGGYNSIADRFDQAKTTLENNRKVIELSRELTETEKQEYDKQLALINDYQQRSEASYVEYYAELTKQNNDWHNGLTKALKDYNDNAGFTAKNTETLFTNAFKGMEDALVTFATTGKLSFKSMIDSFVADIIRLTIQEELIKPINQYLSPDTSNGNSYGNMSSGIGGFLSSAAGLIGDLFGGGGSTSVSSLGGYASAAGISGGRALGGPVSSGNMYQVNEKGSPELLNVAGKQYLMMNGSNGAVVPQGTGGGAKTFNVSVNQSFAAGTDKRTIDQAASQASRQLRRAGRVQ